MSSDPSHPGRIYPGPVATDRRGPARLNPARRALAGLNPAHRARARLNPDSRGPAHSALAHRAPVRLGRTAPLSLSLFAVLLAAPIAAAAPAQATTDPADGVTVVVDFTDGGGDVEVGFAPGAPGTGREALEAAGFVPTDSIPGMICAIDAHPDPCPEEFDGEFWSYWSGADDEWVAHTEGADGIDPAPGDIEGWRYNDGSVGPQMTPAEAAEQVAAGEANDGEANDGEANDGGTADDGGAAEGDTGATEDDGVADPDETADEDTGAETDSTETDGAETDTEDAGAGAAIWLMLALVVVLVVVLAVRFVQRSRSADQGDSTDTQD